ncbi:MAG: hypothetical protein A2202_07325 [Bdellovibrionales bacterium RIFOXYA1_FULL_36_14]|nr:MAG: hypothetical protein A2202_07325 [Bdellovibrionales bacterium RIFOXYA1_FULL_36_14]
MKLNKLLIIALLIPLIGIALMIYQSERAIRNDNSYTIPVSGFDPRDILKGHYITYQFNWNLDIDKTLAYLNSKNDKFNSTDVCLCLVESNNNPKAFPIDCDDSVSSCMSKLKGSFSIVSLDKLKNFRNSENQSPKSVPPTFLPEDFRFLTGIEKYYVPESHAQMLQNLINRKEGAIKFRVNNRNKAVLVDLFFNDKQWKKFIEN